MTSGRRRVLASNPLDALLQPPGRQEDGAPPAEGHQDDGKKMSERRHDDGASMTDGPQSGGAPSVRSRSARHKLTTYLPGPLYDWAVSEVDDAKRDGHPAAIADVVRFALEAVRAGNLDELRRRLRGQ